MRQIDWSDAPMYLVLLGGIVIIAIFIFSQPSNKEQAWQNLLRAQEIYREASK